MSQSTYHTIGCRTFGTRTLNTAINTSTKTRAPVKRGHARFSRLTLTSQLLWVGGLAMLLLTLCNWLLQDRDRGAIYLEHYGGLVAEQLSRLSKDAMVREDAIALNVLAEQVASDPAIGSVTVYSLDGRVLAGYGTPSTVNEQRDRSREFNRPIQLADATAGFVRVTVVPQALHPAIESPAGKLATAIRPMAALLLAGLAYWAIIGWLNRPLEFDRKEKAQSCVTQSTIVLVIRLFNSKEMGAARRDALLGMAEVRVAAVAELYGATQWRLDDSSVAVVFAPNQTEDQRFQAACAALAVSRLCNQPGGARYRYSLQEAELPEPNESALSIQATVLQDAGTKGAVADARLLADLAQDNTIAVSSRYAQSLPRPERLELTREHSPALVNLRTTTATDYYLLSGANAATEGMLGRQLENLRAGTG